MLACAIARKISTKTDLLKPTTIEQQAARSLDVGGERHADELAVACH